MNISLDMLEIFFDELKIINNPNLEFIYWLSDNSKTWIYNYYDILSKKEIKFDCVLTTVPWYWKHFRFDYEYEWIKIKDWFSISIWRQQGAIISNNKITFTGSFLTYFWLEFTEKFIDSTFNIKYLLEVKRFDIAVDIPETKKNILSTLLTIPTSEINYNSEKKEYETIYLWSRKSQTSFIRIYDKILDSIKKSKTDLYNFNSDNLTRVEIEFRNTYILSLNKKHYWIIYWRNLLTDKKLLKDLFLNRVSDDMTFFSDIANKDYSFVFIPPKRVDLETYYLKTNQLPTWWKKNALWMFIKLKKIIWIVWLIKYLKLTDVEIKEVLEYYIKIKRDFLNWKIKKVSETKNISKEYFSLVSDQLITAKKINDLLLQDNIAEASEIKEVLENALKKYDLIYKNT